MWPGEQPPGGGQNPQGQQPNPSGQNPYQQPGYQQPNPYAQQPPGQEQAPWNAPTLTASPPEPPRKGKRRTTVIATVAAAAVAIAACVTGFVVLGGGKDDKADPDPSTSDTSNPTESGNPRSGGTDKPTIPGWKVVVNPKQGIAFDVPPDWSRKSTSWVSYVSEDTDPSDKPLVAFAAPAFLKEQWCASDDDKDGTVDYTPLGGAGTKGNKGSRSTEEVAGKDPALWVYGGYTQPHKDLVKNGPVEPYTTKSGLTGSLGTATSSGVSKRDKCDFDGKAMTFAFKNAEGDFASWTFEGVKGAKDEIPDSTVRKILSTVRLYKEPPAN
ncbi:hypothetical protein [Streptomyces colonosanans]|uniref:DUF8017 domain-containing protein n=1 Tax=Streptomyces colonosanans TaxID=1428652 RepID=A0A1S2Q390_9ACTN|nr:hypothetical protein [Streptomyces colonosanans]OIK00091.1 hypothetical protein BIV24_03480 [Streptomyces colonosanans]